MSEDAIRKKLLGAFYTESYDVAAKQEVKLVKMVGILEHEFPVFRNEEDDARIAPASEIMGGPDQFGR
jgi:hypothetical protein